MINENVFALILLCKFEVFISLSAYFQETANCVGLDLELSFFMDIALLFLLNSL